MHVQLFKSALVVLALGLIIPSMCQVPVAIESVEYDAAGMRWFVSNGDNVLVTSNRGRNYTVFGNATATHGMEVVDNMLVTITNSVINAYSLTTGGLLGTLNVAGAQYLNGMGSLPGEVIVSDFTAKRILRVDISDPANMTASILVENTRTTPNGVVIDEPNNRAIVVNWGPGAPILAVSLTDGSVTTLMNNTELGYLDGIDSDGRGNFFVSSWIPTRISKFSNNFSVVNTVATASDGLDRPADISYSVETGVLGVANSGNNVPTWFELASSASSPVVSTNATASANASGVGAGLIGSNLDGNNVTASNAGNTTSMCMVNGTSYAINETIGLIAYSCMGNSTWNGTRVLCSRDGTIQSQAYVATCTIATSSATPYCVQCGAGSSIAAQCRETLDAGCDTSLQQPTQGVLPQVSSAASTLQLNRLLLVSAIMALTARFLAM